MADSIVGLSELVDTLADRTENTIEEKKDIIKFLEFVRIILQFILIESFQFLQCSESCLFLENAIVFATSDEESLIFVNAVFS